MKDKRTGMTRSVLILIVMDNGLLQRGDCHFRPEQGVLILIVMDNGLLLLGRKDHRGERQTCLNPYCNG